MRKIYSLLLIVGMLIVISACSQGEVASDGEENYVLRVSHPYQLGTLHHQYMV